MKNVPPIVDVQNDFIGGSLAVSDAKDIRANVKRRIRRHYSDSRLASALKK